MKKGWMRGSVWAWVVVAMLAIVGSLAFKGLIAGRPSGFPWDIPPDGRIAYANRLAGGGVGYQPSDRLHMAGDKFVYLFELGLGDIGTNASSELHDIDVRLNALACAPSWAPIERRWLKEWLNTNGEALALLAEETDAGPHVLALSAENGKIFDAAAGIEAVSFLRYGKLMAIAANERALAGDWPGAYSWLRRLFGLADLAYQQPVLIAQYMGMAVDRFACEQARALAARPVPGLRESLLAIIEGREDRRCPDSVIAAVDDLIVLDLIERQFAWAMDPDAHPETESIVQLYIGDAGSLPGVSSVPGAPASPPFPDVDTYRRAVRKSSVARSWEVHQQLCACTERWAGQSFASRGGDAEEFRQSYYAIARTEPVQALLNSTFITPDNHGRLLATTAAERNATSTVLRILVYKESRGSLPGDLSELADGESPVFAEDPFSGETLIYVPDHAAGAFKLYSVGLNQQDDGGKHDDAPYPNDGDIVYWPLY